MKRSSTLILLVALPLIFFSFPIQGASNNPLQGKIIALDAGHGGDDLGATYPPNAGESGDVYEKDINLATIYTLKEKIEANATTACVVLTRECDENISWNKDRVDMAEEKCKSKCGGECDVLVSVHHNGSTDENYDGLLTIYNNPKDYELATKLHNRSLEGLFNASSTYDESYDKGGYGMTVYFTPASLTEGYYVTNKCEAEIFSTSTIWVDGDWSASCPSVIYGDSPNSTTTSFSCSATSSYSGEPTERSFDYGPQRVDQEVNALYWGLFDYFDATSEDGGNGGGNGKGKDCPPGQRKKGEC